MSPKSRTRLRRIAREAQHTYVGRHWPTMRDMRRDGIGFALVEGPEREAHIRRFIATFSPEMVLAILDDVKPVPIGEYVWAPSGSAGGATKP